MCLGALVSAGVDPKRLEAALEKAGFTEFKLSAQKVHRKGLAATQIRIEFTETAPPFRHLGDIEALIERSTLSEWVKSQALMVFRRLAQAEARVHNQPLDKVHFHEVGALDAIIDIIGTLLGLEILGIEQIYASALPFGRGPIICQHGILPNPAPATLELCRGIPMFDTGIEGELVTPTGAALITTLATQFNRLPQLRIERIGYGAGSKTMDYPNILRLWIGDLEVSDNHGQLAADLHGLLPDLLNNLPQAPESSSAANPATNGPASVDSDPANQADPKNWQLENIYILDCTLDDMNPEWFTYLRKRLEDAGALEIICRQVQMKKNRPGIELAVLASAASIPQIVPIILGESTSLGLRMRREQRLCLSREITELETPLGPVRVKWSWAPTVQGGWYKRGKPEFESCRQLAEKLKLPLPEVYAYLNSFIASAALEPEPKSLL